MLIKLFGDNRRDLLRLLLLATRHDQFDIIQDILPKVNLGCILDLANPPPPTPIHH